MGRPKRSPVRRAAVLALLAAVLTACSSTFLLPKRPVKSMTPVFIVEDFPTEIARLERIAREDPSPEVRAEAHFQLAALWSHYKNPDIRYERALSELETYLRMKPEARLLEQNANWRSVLEALVSLRRERGELRARLRRIEADYARLAEEAAASSRLQDSLSSMQQKIEALTAENEKMREAIEKLKSLDLWLEEQRGQIR